MEENQPKTGKYALKYGIILGVIGIVFALMLYSMDMHYQYDLKRIATDIGIGLVFIIVASIFAMREFKKANNGFMSFGQAMKIGVGLALVSGIIGLIFSFILTEVIDPDTNQKIMDYTVEWMREMDIPEAKIDEQIEGQKNQTPIRKIATQLMFSIVLGFIGALFPALALKKSENVN